MAGETTGVRVAEPLKPFTDGWDYPMVIVTTAAPGGPDTAPERSGCLAGFTTQCSIDPVRFLVCLSVANHTYRTALRARALAVHGLSPDRRALAELFGTATGDEVDKFARCEWRPGPDGVPLLAGCPRGFIGAVVDRVELGDHVGFVLEPLDAYGDRDARPMMFSDVCDLEAGHEAD